MIQKTIIKKFKNIVFIVFYTINIYILNYKNQLNFKTHLM